MLNSQILTEQAVFLFVSQIQAVQNGLQTGADILAVGIGKVSHDDLACHSIAIRCVGCQLVGVAAGCLVKLLNALVTVQPCLIQNAGLCLDFLAKGACIRVLFFAQANIAGCGVCIQGIISVDLVSQLVDKRCILAGQLALEMGGELGRVDSSRFTVLQVLAHILSQTLAVPQLLVIGSFALTQGSFQLLLHGTVQLIQQTVAQAQSVPQLMRNGRQVIGNLGSDTLVALVELAAHTGAANMAGGDVQVEVMTDFLHNLGHTHRSLFRAAHTVSCPLIGVIHQAVAGLMHHIALFIVQSCHILFVCGVQLQHDLGVTLAQLGQLVSLIKAGGDGLFQLADGAAVLAQPGLGVFHHTVQSAGDVLQGADGTVCSLHIHRATVLPLPFQQNFGLVVHQQGKAGKLTNLKGLFLDVGVDIGVLLCQGDNGITGSLTLGDGLAVQNNAELVAGGVLTDCKVSLIVSQQLGVADNHHFGIGNASLRLGDFLGVGTLQVLQSGDLGSHFHLLDNQRVTGGNRLDLGSRQGKVTVTLALAGGQVTGHDLVNKGCLTLQVVPHSAVKGLLGDVDINAHFLIDVAPTENTALALLNVTGSPRRIQVMQGNHTLLSVHAHTHLTGGADQHTHLAIVHILEQLGLFIVGIGIMDKCHFPGRHTGSNQSVADIVIDGDILHSLLHFGLVGGLCVGAALRCGQVAEDQLRALDILAVFPDLQDIVGTLHDLVVLLIREARVQHTLSIGQLPALAGNLEHIVILGINLAVLDRLGTLGQTVNVVHLERRRFAFHDDALALFHFRDFQTRNIHQDIGKCTEHLLQLGQVLEAGKALLLAEALTAGVHFQNGTHFAELICPGIEAGQAACIQQVTLQVLLHDIHFAHAVHNRRCGGENHAPAAVELL